MRAFILISLMLLIGVAWAASSDKETAKPNPNPIVETVWGPDAYGYIARDSNEPNGPPVEWIDISTIGTVVPGLGDDNIVGPFNIGFPFRYYWYDVPSFYVGSNGYIRFSGTGQLSSPFTLIPNATPPNDIICPFTADFDPSSGGTVYYWSNGVDTLIVSWDHVPAWNTPTSLGDHNFQLVLSMVDTSITFNIGPLTTGSFFNTAGMVGIENNAGNIGIYNYPTNAVPQNYSIKFYYPQNSNYPVDDIAVTRVQNDNSGGFFVQTGGTLQANATVKNTGNQDASNFYVVAEVRQYPGNTLIFDDSVLIASLNPGQTEELTFTETWTMDTPGNYYLRVKALLPGDLVASNDQIDVELHVVDLPGELSLDDGTNENTWSWAGGNGGMGIYYLPPTYPVKITEIKGWLEPGTNLLPSLLELYDDDGPNGEPGTQLASASINPSVANWYTVDVSGSNITITDGGVYVVWNMTGDGSAGLGIDNTSLASRQTWEYTGVWASYRDAEISDAMLRLSVEPQGQVVFSDDFESGLGNWTGDWALTTEASNSPVNSYTDSPGGNYPPASTLIGAMANGVDLSSYFGATLEFYTKYELETGFDYCYLEASTDGGSNWLLLKTYNGEGVVTQFTQETIDIGPFAGASDFRIRFRLVTDGAYEVDGMYVDDVTIIGSLDDVSGPLVLFDPPQHYLGVPGDFPVEATITDLSGVATATLTYWIDGDPSTSATINPTSVSGDLYLFDIPQQEHGALVEFYLFAEDGASPANSTTTATARYISGEHQVYDDGEPEFIVPIAPGTQIATRFDAPSGTLPAVKTGLLRIYTDINNPIDDVTFHIWADNGGLPGADLVAPFIITPDATVADPQAWSVVDLRGLNIQPGGGFWIGWENTSALTINQLYDSPVSYNRSFQNTGAGWTAFAGDYHIRAVVGEPEVAIGDPVVNALPTDFALEQNFPNPFNPTTTIKYALKENADVTLRIYNVLGQVVKTLVNARQDAGFKTVSWDGTNDLGAKVSSGIYIYRIEANDFVQSKKLILMK